MSGIQMLMLGAKTVLQATISPNPLEAFVPNGSNNFAFTANPIGGSGSYSYSWSVVSGSGSFTAGATSKNATYTDSGFNVQKFATIRCVVTDTVYGNNVQPTASVDITFGTP